MKIATWNVNSIKARLPVVEAWLRQARPDVVCLQEIKCLTENFPATVFEDLGYNLAVVGQKTFNGVAIAARHPIEDVTEALPGDATDEQARFVEAVISLPHGIVRVASVYVPNGNPVGSEKFSYKLAWLDRLRAHVAQRLTLEEPYVVAGDYNVIPTPQDVYDPVGWEDDALFRLETRQAFRALLHLGLTDAVSACFPDGPHYTFWDYKGGAWVKNHGLRIDHILLSPQAADRLVQCEIESAPRGWERPSDHVPVWARLGPDVADTEASA